VAKHTFLVRTIDELPRVMDEAFRLAGGGRPGPVVVDVPKDIQMQSVSQAKGLTAGGQAKIGPVDEKKIIEIARMINSARRPILYLGGGRHIIGFIGTGPGAFAKGLHSGDILSHGTGKRASR
jgi:acetolactate synthase-1/2/3 large subunit